MKRQVKSPARHDNVTPEMAKKAVARVMYKGPEHWSEMMRTFAGFNESGGDTCPVCHTNKNVETVLVPMPETERDGNVQCVQVHKKCYDIVAEMQEETP